MFDKELKELFGEAEKTAIQKLKDEREASGSNTQEQPEHVEPKKDKGKQKENREKAEELEQRTKEINKRFKEQEETFKAIKSNQAFLNQRKEELKLQERAIDDREKQLGKARREKAVSVEGKAVIQAQISEELTEIKETFESIKISEVSEEEIKNKLAKKIEKAADKANQQIGGGRYFLSNIPLLSMGMVSDAKSHTIGEFTRVMKEEAEGTVRKLVDNATADLNEQKKEAVKKIDTLITARNEEVVNAQKVILQLESVIAGLKEQNEKEKEEAETKISDLEKEQVALSKKSEEDIRKLIKMGEGKLTEKDKEKDEIRKKLEGEIIDLKNLSAEEIGKLRGSIKELTNQLKEFEEGKKKHEKLIQERIAERLKEASQKKPTMKTTMKDNEERIKALEELVEELKIAVEFYKDAENLKKTELKNEETSHERTKEVAKNQLERAKETAEKNLKSEREQYELKIKNLKSELEREKEFLNNRIADKQAELERARETAEKKLAGEIKLYEFKLTT